MQRVMTNMIPVRIVLLISLVFGFSLTWTGRANAQSGTLAGMSCSSPNVPNVTVVNDGGGNYTCILNYGPTKNYQLELKVTGTCLPNGTQPGISEYAYAQKCTKYSYSLQINGTGVTQCLPSGNIGYVQAVASVTNLDGGPAPPPTFEYMDCSLNFEESSPGAVTNPVC